MISCKGRNGQFKYNSHTTWKSGNVALVQIFSRRKGPGAPITFFGTPNELIGLFNNIIKELKGEKDGAKSGSE